MKIIFLNTWEGTLRNEMIDFLTSNISSTNIFCFQEVNNGMLEICDLLNDKYVKIEAIKEATEKNVFYQQTYINKNIKIQSQDIVMNDDVETGIGLYTELNFDGQIIHLCNVHGLAYPGDKLDNPARIRQSESLIKFMDKFEGPKIIGGDFNLFPETKSVKLFEEGGYRNLIKEYEIRNTRNKYVWDKYPGTPQYFADFTFVSSDISIQNFEVPHIEVSDHLPMYLEIEF